MSRAVQRRVALVALCACVAGAVLVLRSSDSPDQEMTAIFESAQGLIASGEVRAGGIVIGEVTKIKLADDGYPHVSFTVTDEYEVRRGATVNVRLDSQAGQLSRYIDISNGDGDPLPKGATFGLASTDEPVEVNDLVSALTPEIRRDVRTILSRADKTFEGRGPDIERTLRVAGASLSQVASLAGDVSSDRRALQRLVNRTSDGVEQLAAVQDDITGVTAETARLMAVAEQRQQEVGEILRTAPASLASPRAVMRRTARDLPAVTRVLRETDRQTEGLGATGRELLRATSIAPDAVNAALALAKKTQKQGPLITDLISSLAPALENGGTALKGLNPVLDQFRTRAPDALGWFFLFGDATASYDAAGHGLRLMGSLPEVPRRYTKGLGDCGAGLLRRPFDRMPGELACEPWLDFAKSFAGGGVDPAGQVDPQRAASQDVDVR